MQQLDPKLELPRPPRPLIESNPVALTYPVQALGGILGTAVERMSVGSGSAMSENWWRRLFLVSSEGYRRRDAERGG